MIELLERCFCEKMKSAEWQEKMKVIIPSYGIKLNENEAVFESVKKMTTEVLHLEE